MRKDELVLNIYRMDCKRGCLVIMVKGKKPLKILNILEPLRFVGWIKQLSIAIDTGANQNCKHTLKCLNSEDRVLKCRFANDKVELKLKFKGLLRLHWQGTAKGFAATVDQMIAKMPRFF